MSISSHSSDGTWEDNDGSCPYTGVEEFLLDGDDLYKSGGGDDAVKTNLFIRITTTGTQFLPSGKDGSKPGQYDCKYVTTIDILSKGSGWKRGDEFKLTVSGREYKVRVDDVDRYVINGVDAVIRPKLSLVMGRLLSSLTTSWLQLKLKLENTTVISTLKLLVTVFMFPGKRKMTNHSLLSPHLKET